MKFSRLVIVSFHIAFWLLTSIVPLVLIPMMKATTERTDSNLFGIIHVLLVIAIFYFNYYFLYPKFFIRKKITAYVVLCLLTALTFTATYSVIRQASQNITGSLLLFIFVKSFISLAAIAMSTFYRLMVDTIQQQQAQQQREKEQLKTELSFLRSQVSPHFMFNVLNSLVALIRQKSDQLEPIVMELSNLMRYMLYESDEEKVRLQTEIEYLKSYITIQLLRFGEDVKMALDIQADIPDKLIEPMLLIPLVENAFKHGIGLVNQPEIRIQLGFSRNELGMVVKNKFSSSIQTLDKRKAGIGLDNLKKRLSLLYPGTHSLSISKNQEWFMVSLQLTMKDEMPSH